MAWFRRSRTAVEERASPENPSTGLSNPDEWLVSWFGGGQSAAGVHVNEESALALTTVYSAISLLAETVAQLPLVLFRKTDRGREVVTDHPAGIAVRRPVSHMTSFRWRELLQGHTLAWGNGYAHIERNVRGEVLSLPPLDPSKTRVEERAGRAVYLTRRKDQEIPLAPSDVLHIPAFGYDGLMGKSPLRVHREAIGLGLAAQTFGAQFFGNGASLGGVLKHPKSLGKEGRSRLKEAWDRMKGQGYQGVAVLEEGMDYTRIGIPPEDAQFIETRKFTRSEIAAIYKIPPHMLADLERSSFNNIAEQSIQFLRFTMMPWLIKWEDELNAKLLTIDEQSQGLFFKFTVQGLMRGTQDQRYTAYNTGIQAGFLSRNEVREWEELDTVDGLDEFLTPMNMAGQDQPQDPPADPPQDPDPKRLLLPVAGRIAQTVSSMVGKAVERGVDRRAWLADAKTVRTIDYHAEPLALAMNDPTLAADLRVWLADTQPDAATVLAFLSERYWRSQ